MSKRKMDERITELGHQYQALVCRVSQISVQQLKREGRLANRVAELEKMKRAAERLWAQWHTHSSPPPPPWEESGD